MENDHQAISRAWLRWWTACFGQACVKRADTSPCIALCRPKPAQAFSRNRVSLPGRLPCGQASGGGTRGVAFSAIRASAWACASRRTALAGWAFTYSVSQLRSSASSKVNSTKNEPESERSFTFPKALNGPLHAKGCPGSGTNFPELSFTEVTVWTCGFTSLPQPLKLSFIVVVCLIEGTWSLPHRQTSGLD